MTAKWATAHLGGPGIQRVLKPKRRVEVSDVDPIADMMGARGGFGRGNAVSVREPPARKHSMQVVA